MFSAPLDNFGTFFGHFFCHIFWAFCRHFQFARYKSKPFLLILLVLPLVFQHFFVRKEEGQNAQKMVLITTSYFSVTFSLLSGRPPVCTHVKWVPFVLLAFFPPCFTAFVASKLAIFPLKHSVLGAWKGHFRAPKRTNGGFWVPRPQNHLKCL